MSLNEILKKNGFENELKPLLFCDNSPPVLGYSIEGQKAIRSWNALRELAPEIGHWPIILGNQEDIDINPGYCPNYERPELPKDWFAYRRTPNFWEDRLRPLIQGLSDKGISIPPYLMRTYEPVKRKPVCLQPEQCEPRDVFVALHSKEQSDIFIAFLPIEHSWRAAQSRGFGGFNSCPYPVEHAAVHREWFERFGAEVVTITRDMVEMRVTKPPTTWREAFELAEDQELYAEFDQMEELCTTESLAASLLNAPCWSFWWD